MGGNVSESLFFPMINPDGLKVLPFEKDGRKGCWRWSKKKVEEESERIEWVKGRKGEWTPYFKIYAENRRARPLETVWTHQEVGSNRTSKNEMRSLFQSDPFGTPKPEKLIQKVIIAASNPNDIVLDSFLGSGTTAAVAHKMGRRWIGIELGEHAYTHCLPRLKKVVDGSDQGGISKAMNWTGGGGFKVYKLAESLLEYDDKGILHVNPDFTNEMVAEAVAKIEGYTYAPPTLQSGEETVRPFWQQAKGLDKSYLYVTTIFISREWLDQLAEQVPSDVSLMVCCPAYTEGCERAYKHIKLKKIPQAFQDAYEFDKNDYSLKVENVMPQEEDSPSQSPQEEEDFKKRSKKTGNTQASLF